MTSIAHATAPIVPFAARGRSASNVARRLL